MSDELLRSDDDDTPRTSEDDVGQTMAVADPAAGGVTTVTVREDVLSSAAAVAGFVAGAGGVGAAIGLPLQIVGLKRRTPFPKGTRMRNRRNAQLAPAMYSLAATNAQLLGLVGSRRPLLSAARYGIALAAVAYFTADEEGRNKMINQATGLVEQGGALVANSGILEVLFKK